MKNNIKKLTYTAIFAALICVFTMIIKIPVQSTGGYIHLGDAFVILAGMLLGGVYGGIAAGIGSALADLFGGYMVFVPITFLVKALAGFGVGVIYKKLSALGISDKKSNLKNCFICGLYSAIVVILGYFVFEFVLYQSGAFLSIPANILQTFVGMIISTLLFPQFKKFIKL